MQSKEFYIVVSVDDEIVLHPVENSGESGQLTFTPLSPKTDDYDQPIVTS